MEGMGEIVYREVHGNSFLNINTEDMNIGNERNSPAVFLFVILYVYV
jgi:hypothetical protein